MKCKPKLFTLTFCLLLAFLSAKAEAITTTSPFNLSFNTGESFQVQIQDSPNLFITFIVQSGTLVGTGNLNTTDTTGIFLITPSTSGTLTISYPPNVNLYINGIRYTTPYAYTSGNSFTITWDYNIYTLTITCTPLRAYFSINGSTQWTPYSKSLIEATYVLEFPETFTYASQTWTFLYWNNDTNDINPTKTVNLTNNMVLNVTYVSGYFSRIAEPVFAYEMGEFIREDSISNRLILFDSSKYKNYAIFPNSDCAPTQVVGRYGFGLHFDGNDYALVSDSNTLRINPLMTISVWIKPTKFTTSTQYIIRKDNEYDITITSKILSFNIYDGSRWFTAQYNSNLTINTWYFVLCEISQSSISLYIDGTLRNTTIITGSFTSTTNNVYIGYNFTGIIDELQGYHRVLSSTEKMIVRINQIPAPSDYIFTSLSSTSTTSVMMDYYNTGDNMFTRSYGDSWTAQTFTVQTFWYNIASVRLKLKKEGNPTGTFTVSIRKVDANGKPTGSDLTSGSISATSITSSASGAWYTITFSSAYPLQVNVMYAIVARLSGGDSSNDVCWFYDNNGAYNFGILLQSSDAGSTWTGYSNYDHMFETYGSMAKCGFIDNHIETPWATDGECAKVDYYIVGFQKFHSLVTIDQVGGTSDNAYFQWSFSFYRKGTLVVTYQVKITYTNLQTQQLTLTFQSYLPKTGTTTTYKTVPLNLNGTGMYARAWKVAIDGCNYIDYKSFQIRVVSDTQEQIVMDENTKEYWWEYFFDLVDENGNIVNLQYYDAVVKVTVLVQSATGITTMVKTHTHLAWFVWLAIITIVSAVTFFGVAYALTGGHLESIPVIGGAMQGITDWFTNLANAIGNVLKPIGDWIVNSLIGATQPLLSAIASAANWLMQQLIAGLDMVFGLFGWQNGFSQILSFLGSIFGIVSQAFNVFVSMMGIIVNVFIGVFIQIYNIFANAINTVATITQAIGWIWSQIAPTLGWVVDVFWGLLPLLFVFYCLWVIAPLIDEGDWHKSYQRIEDTVGLMWRITMGLIHIVEMAINAIYRIVEMIPVVE